MLKNWILFLSLTVASGAFAGNDQVPIDRTIYQIKTYDGWAVIYFTPGFANTQGCASTVQDRVILKVSGSGDWLYTAAVAAATSGQKVGFGIGGCDTGSLKYPTIYRIDVDY